MADSPHIILILGILWLSITGAVFVPPDIVTETEPDLSRLGQDALSEHIFAWISDAERNEPFVRGNGRDAFGKPKSELVTGEGWRKLQDFGIKRG